jgi:hypothetical protein
VTREQTANSNQQTANSKQQSANSNQQSANSNQQSAISKQQSAISKQQSVNNNQQTAEGRRHEAERNNWLECGSAAAPCGKALPYRCSALDLLEAMPQRIGGRHSLKVLRGPLGKAEPYRRVRRPSRVKPVDAFWLFAVCCLLIADCCLLIADC